MLSAGIMWNLLSLLCPRPARRGLRAGHPGPMWAQEQRQNAQPAAAKQARQHAAAREGIHPLSRSFETLLKGNSTHHFVISMPLTLEVQIGEWVVEMVCASGVACGIVIRTSVHIPRYWPRASTCLHCNTFFRAWCNLVLLHFLLAPPILHGTVQMTAELSMQSLYQAGHLSSAHMQRMLPRQTSRPARCHPQCAWHSRRCASVTTSPSCWTACSTVPRLQRLCKVRLHA